MLIRLLKIGALWNENSAGLSRIDQLRKASEYSHSTTRVLLYTIVISGAVAALFPSIAFADDDDDDDDDGGNNSGDDEGYIEKAREAIAGALPDAGISEAFVSAMSFIFDGVAYAMGWVMMWFFYYVGVFLETPLPPEAPGIAATPGTGIGSSAFGTFGELNTLFSELAISLIIAYAAWYIASIGLGRYSASSKGRILLMFGVAIGVIGASAELIALFYEFLHALTEAILPSTNVGQGIMQESLAGVTDIDADGSLENMAKSIGIGGLTNAAIILLYPMTTTLFSLVGGFVLLVLVMFLIVRLIALYALYAAAPLVLVIYTLKQGPAKLLTGPADRFISTTVSLAVASIPLAIALRIGVELSMAMADTLPFGGGYLLAVATLSASTYFALKTTDTTKSIAGKLKTAGLIAGTVGAVALSGGAAGAVMRGAAYRGSSGAMAMGASEIGTSASKKVKENGLPSPFGRVFGDDETDLDDADKPEALQDLEDKSDLEHAIDQTENTADDDDDGFNAFSRSPAAERKKDLTQQALEQANENGNLDEVTSYLSEQGYLEEEYAEDPDTIAADEETEVGDGPESDGTPESASDIGPDDGRELDTATDSQTAWSATGRSGTDWSTAADSVDSQIDPDEEMGVVDDPPLPDEALDGDGGYYMKLGDAAEARSDSELAETMPDSDSVAISEDEDGNLMFNVPDGEAEDVKSRISQATNGRADIEETEDGNLKMDPANYEDSIHGELMTGLNGPEKTLGFENSATEAIADAHTSESAGTATPNGRLLDSEALQDRHDVEEARRRAEAEGKEELSKRLANPGDQFLLETDDMPASIADEVTPDTAAKSDTLGGYLLDTSELEQAAQGLNDAGATISPTDQVQRHLSEQGISTGSASQTVAASVGSLGSIAPAGEDKRLDIVVGDDGKVDQINPSADIDANKAQLSRLSYSRMDDAGNEVVDTHDASTLDLTQIDSEKRAPVRKALNGLDGAEPISTGSNGEAYEYKVKTEGNTTSQVANLLKTNGIDFQADEYTASNIDLEAAGQATTLVDVPSTDDAVVQFLPTESGSVYPTSATAPRGGVVDAGLSPDTGSVTLEGTGVDTDAFLDVVEPNITDEAAEAIANGDRMPVVEFMQRDLAQDTVRRAANKTGIQMDPSDAQALGLTREQTSKSQSYQVDLGDITGETSPEIISIDGGAGAEPEVNLHSSSDTISDYDLAITESDNAVRLNMPNSKSSNVMKAVGSDLISGAPQEVGEDVTAAVLSADNVEQNLEQAITRAQSAGLNVKATRSAFETAGKNPATIQSQLNINDGEQVQFDFSRSNNPSVSTVSRTEAAKADARVRTIEGTGPSEPTEMEIELSAAEHVQELRSTLEQRVDDVRVIDDDTPTIRSPAVPEEVKRAVRDAGIQTTFDRESFAELNSVSEVSRKESTHDKDLAGYHADGWMLDPDE